MVPIHDSDLASERYAQAEWQHYELWEKIEVRLKRRRNLWIAATVLVFLLLSSIPILTDHWPRWTALKASRRLGDQINVIKRMAGTENHAYRLEFAANHQLSYTVIQLASCSAPSSSGTVVQSGSLLTGTQLEKYVLLTPEQGRAIGLPGLVDSICYDPLGGSQGTPGAESISGFGILPAKDLAAGRQDRLSLLIFKGPSAEVSFE